MIFGRNGGVWEILIVLIIILLLFGPGRIAKVAKELGESIAAFREGLNEKDTSSQAEHKDDSDESNR